MQIGTIMKKNARKMILVNERGRPVGESHHRAKLTDHEVELILALRADGMPQWEVAQKFEVSRRTVRDIEQARRRAQPAAEVRHPRSEADRQREKRRHWPSREPERRARWPHLIKPAKPWEFD